MYKRQLGDVVVTGYQELERRKLTAAIAKVDVTDGMVGAAKSIDQALSLIHICHRISSEILDESAHYHSYQLCATIFFKRTDHAK